MTTIKKVAVITTTVKPMGDPYLVKMQKYFKNNGRVRDFKENTGKIHTLGWNCDGKKLAFGSWDKSLTISSFDRDRLTRCIQYREHTESVDQLRWHPTKPDILLTASGDKTIRIWDTKCPKSIHSFTTKGENLNIAWSPLGNCFAVGNKDDLVSFFEYPSMNKCGETQFKCEINELTWNSRGDQVFLTSGQGCIFVLEYPSLNQLACIKAHTSNCICIEFDKKGDLFATGSTDSMMSVWDADEMVINRMFPNLSWPVRTLSFSHDSKMIASASENMQINIADVETGRTILDIKIDRPTFSVAWHPKRFILAYSSEDKDKYDYHKDSANSASFCKGSIKLYGFGADK